MLASRVGVQHIESVEDAVQSALIIAYETWKIKEVPENPSAWLYKVAFNNIISGLRQNTHRQRILADNPDLNKNLAKADPNTFLVGEVKDDLLRMLFVCCDKEIPPDSQLVFALKTLCGFSIPEIALRLFTSEANTYKRLERARNCLRKIAPNKSPLDINEIQSIEIKSRIPAVNRVLYSLFTEGYFSSHINQAIRRELCEEAIRLAKILAEHPAGQNPETSALIALMYLHSARMASRIDDMGGLLLLEEQNRKGWDKQRIHIGLQWLAKSAQGQEFSRYHAEAGISAEHCLATSFEETNWTKIVECYDLLERDSDSALHRLNKAVAVAEWKGPEEGLAVVEGFQPPTWLEGSYLWCAVLADLHRRCGNKKKAQHHGKIALNLAPSNRIKELLKRRLAMGD